MLLKNNSNEPILRHHSNVLNQHRRLNHQEEGKAMSVMPSDSCWFQISAKTYNTRPVLTQVFTLLIGSMVLAQLLLVYWRKRHYRTYQQVLFGLVWCYSSRRQIHMVCWSAGYTAGTLGHTFPVCYINALLQVDGWAHSVDDRVGLQLPCPSELWSTAAYRAGLGTPFTEPRAGRCQTRPLV